MQWPPRAKNRAEILIPNQRVAGAPRPMKMGTIASPWRYDAGACRMLRPERLRLPAISRHASRVKVFRCRERVRVPSLDSRRAEPPWGPTRCATTRHGIYHFRLASGLATSRAQSMKSLATGPSARSFRVTIPFGRRAVGSSTGKTLSSERLVRNLNAEAGKIVTKRRSPTD